MNKLLSLLALLGLLAWSGCRCDDPTDPACPNYCDNPANPRCPNYDPCYGIGDVSAAFRMEEDVPYVITDSLSFRYIDTDTSRSPHVRFTALDPRATYEWYIGAGRYTKRQFTLRFDEVQRDAPGSTIPITLVATRLLHDSACFAGRPEQDTLTRYLTIVDECSTRITGRFLGRWVNKPGRTDTFTVRIIISDYPYYSGSCDLRTITNLEGPGSDCENWDSGVSFGYRQMALGNSFGPEPGICDLDQALAWTEQGSDSVTIQYRMSTNRAVPSSPTEYFIFKGIRTGN